MGPALQVFTFLYRIRSEQEAFERAKEERLAKEQQIADAAEAALAAGAADLNMYMRCSRPVETNLARKMAGLKGEAARCAQDQAVLTQSRARLSLLREASATSAKTARTRRPLRHAQQHT